MHEMHFPEANRHFCSISYLLDHPHLQDGTDIPLVHFIKTKGSANLPEVHQLRNKALTFENGIDDVYEPLPFRHGELISLAHEQASESRYLKDSNDFIFLELSRGDTNLQTLFDQAEPQATFAVKRDRLVGAVTATRRLAIYAVYVPDGRLKTYHRNMLRALQQAGYATVIVNSTFTGAVCLQEQTCDLAEGIILRRGNGRDFASWVIALTHLAPALASADHLLLLNDSLIGPFGNLGSVIKAMESDRADFKGLTESNETAHHLQSSLLMLTREAVFSRPFLSFLLRFVPGLTRKQVIEDGEIGLSQQMMAAGVTATARIPYTEVTRSWLEQVPDHITWAHSLPEKLEDTKLFKLFSPEVAARFAGYLEDWLLAMHSHLVGGSPVNPQQVCWDMLLQDGNFPFLKKELILVNPLRVPTLIRVFDLLPPEQRSEAAGLLMDLVEIADGFPRSYLRLSSSLLDTMVNDDPRVRIKR